MVTRLALRWTVVLGLLSSVFMVPGIARAQDYDAAGRLYAAGQERYSQKRFHTAALEFQAAYEITKDPALLYNVGDAWQHGGDATRAVAAYRAYLKERPDAQDRADVESRIKTLGGKKKALDESMPGDKDESAKWLAQGGAPAIPAPTPPPEPPPPPAPEVAPPAAVAPAAPEPAKTEPVKAPEPAPAMQIGLLDDKPVGKLRIAAWASVAATIALVTTGAILGLAAQSRADEISRRLNFVDSSGQPNEFDAGAKADFQNLKDEGHLYNGLAIGFYSAAGAMAITSTVLFLVDWKRGKAAKESKQALHVAPSVAKGSAGLVLGGAF